MAKSSDGLVGLLGLAALGGFVWLVADSLTPKPPPPKRRPVLPPARALELHNFMLGQLRQVSVRLGAQAPAIRANDSIAAIHAAGNVIEYNPIWVDAKLQQYCGNEACVYSIITGLLGHEMSHIIHDDRYSGHVSHNYAIELRADGVAGWVLAKLGHPVTDLQKLFAEFQAFGSATHPPALDRIARIENGFWRGQNGYHWA